MSLKEFLTIQIPGSLGKLTYNDEKNSPCKNKFNHFWCQYISPIGAESVTFGLGFLAARSALQGNYGLILGLSLFNIGYRICLYSRLIDNPDENNNNNEGNYDNDDDSGPPRPLPRNPLTNTNNLEQYISA